MDKGKDHESLRPDKTLPFNVGVFFARWSKRVVPCDAVGDEQFDEVDAVLLYEFGLVLCLQLSNCAAVLEILQSILVCSDLMC